MKSAEAIEAQSPLNGITPAMDRHNGLVLLISYVLIYFAAPVVYVGVVQAALFDMLGTSATLANLPTSTYLFGACAPFIVSGLISDRWARAVVVVAYLTTTAVLTIVGAVLFFPFSDSVRIAVVIGQGLIQGCAGSVAQIYTFQCLGRGTTLAGRARALKITFALTPIAAVVGSLAAQFVLNTKIPGLSFPRDFALLYFIGIPCLAGAAFLCSRFQLVSVPEKKRPPFFRYLFDAVKSYVRVRPLVWLWLTFFFWFFPYNAMSNLSLYTREAMGRDPKEFSGLIMALRFGFKSVGGFLLGVITIKWGVRAPLITTILMVGGAILWAWFVPGYFYLFAFGLMGAGELAGAYFPNYVVTISSPESSARNLSLMYLVTLASSIAPALHGALTDWFGFQASFALGTVTAFLALCLALKLPLGPRVENHGGTGT